MAKRRVPAGRAPANRRREWSAPAGAPALTRRTLIGAPLSAAVLLGLPSRLLPQERQGPSWASFPSQDPSRVYDIVLYAHTEIDQVRALLESSPALANATMDWGFGDWETALGAASHMGRRDIAQLLLDHGARPDIFTFAMMGNVAAVQAAIEARPGVQSTPGPHGISLLAHARAGGDESQPVVEYLEELGEADPPQASEPLLLAPDAYAGTYAWGSGEDERVVILERRGALAFRRGERFPRRMFHLGNHEFHPGGAPHVRIRFEVADERAIGLSVVDSELVMAARRVEG